MLSVLNGREVSVESGIKSEPVDTARRVPHDDSAVLLDDFKALMARNVFDLDLTFAPLNFTAAFSSTDFRLCLAHS